MSEYPKVVHVGGITVTVDSAAEEARWCAKPVPETTPETTVEVESVMDLMAEHGESEPADPLDDVSVEMDNPAFQPPAKKKKTAKKK